MFNKKNEPEKGEVEEAVAIPIEVPTVEIVDIEAQHAVEIEEIRITKQKRAEWENLKEHLAMFHGMKTADTSGMIILEYLHENDHASKKTQFYTPHEHNGIEVVLEATPNHVPKEWGGGEGLQAIHPKFG